MASTSLGLLDEEGLRSRLSQLRTEFTIFDRIIFKYKNQHRRAPYFGRLMKVRRDLRLLNVAGMEEILKLAFQVIHGKKPKEMIYILERLKWESSRGRKRTFLDRLLGVARLLSQMVEALTKPAVEISSLLAMNFFTAFALTTLSLLGRFRVLLQQLLLDIVSVFNMVSILAKKEQSFQLTHGVKVFRDFYSANKEFLALRCVWENGQFCLLEISKSTENEDSSVSGGKTDGMSNIDYETVGVLVEGSYDGLGCENEAVEGCAGNQCSAGGNCLHSKAENGLQSGAVLSNNVTGEENKGFGLVDEANSFAGEENKGLGLVDESNSFTGKENKGLGFVDESNSQGTFLEANPSPNQSLDPKVVARTKVAFVSVRNSAQHGKMSNLKKESVDIEGFVASEYVKNSNGSQKKVAHTLSTAVVPSDSKAKAIRDASFISLRKSVEDEGRKLKKPRGGTKDFVDRDSSGSPKESDDYFFNLLAAGSMKDSIF